MTLTRNLFSKAAQVIIPAKQPNSYVLKDSSKDPDEENMRITVIREFEDSRTLDLQDATTLGFQESRIPGFQDSIMLRVWDSRRQEFRIPGV